MTKPKSTARDDLTILRRERVASLVARGLTQREITAALAKPIADGGIRNPDTLEPFDLATINRDLQAIRKENRERTAEAIDTHQARQYAEIQEIKRAAWASKNPQLALAALEKEMKLLGTLRQPDGININLLVVVQRFEQVARDLNLDPITALDEFVGVMNARRESIGRGSG